MESVLKKLFVGNKKDAAETIMREYNRKGYAIVDYLYFANIPGKDLFGNHKEDIHREIFAESLKEEYQLMSKKKVGAVYKKAIMDADFLLPDGIALQLFYWIAAKLKRIEVKKPRLENLNGTDFCLRFLHRLETQVDINQLQIVLYGTYPGILEKTKSFLMDSGFDVVYAQDGFTNLDWEQLDEVLRLKRKKYTVLLVARSTPEYPIQEIWSRANKERFKERKILVMNQAGTFDFWAGVQKRAPRFWRTYKLEWLWRLLSDPKRNYKKVLDSLKIIKYIFLYLLLKRT